MVDMIEAYCVEDLDQDAIYHVVQLDYFDLDP
jgi:hypothetical protein